MLPIVAAIAEPLACAVHTVAGCPPGGTVLDMFAGSGTTGVAAIRGGFNFIGCDEGGPGGKYLPILVGRVQRRRAPGGRPAASGAELVLAANGLL